MSCSFVFGILVFSAILFKGFCIYYREFHFKSSRPWRRRAVRELYSASAIVIVIWYSLEYSALPPSVSAASVAEFADSAQISWEYSRSIKKSGEPFSVYFKYRGLGQLNFANSGIFLPKETFTWLNKLQPNTSYLVNMSTANSCGHTAPLLTEFATSPKNDGMCLLR